MLPVLPKVSKLKERQISGFGGIDKREGAKENYFYDLGGVDNKDGYVIDTVSNFKVVKFPWEFKSNDAIAIPNEDGGNDIYYLGEGGFYKNGELLKLNLTKGTERKWGEEFLENVEFTETESKWTGSYEKTKLIRYGNKIFAVPQMIYTDGEKTYIWDSTVMLKYASDKHYYKSGCISLTTSYSTRQTYFAEYEVGDEIEVICNGKKADVTFTIVKHDETSTDIKCVKNDGGICLSSDLGLTSSSNIFLIRHKGLPKFTDAEVIFNRMWGVEGNRIYASKLARPHCFGVTDGTASDSWWADTEETSNFTAIGSLNGRVAAFKPRAAYEIYGTVNPYTIKDTSRSLGCMDSNSLCEVNGVLFLLTSEGISVYGGSKFVNINEQLRSEDKAVSGKSYGSKFYALLKEGIYKYDYYTGIWTNVIKGTFKNLIELDGDLFALREENDFLQITGKEKSFLSYTEEYVCPWFIESVDIGSSDFYAEGINRIEFRFESIGEGEITVEISRDGGEYESYGTAKVTSGWQIFSVPVFFKPCSHFKYRISGTGEMRLKLIRYRFRKGGEANKYE